MHENFSWSLIAAVLFCSPRTIARWKRRFERGGIDALYGQTWGAPSPWGTRWIAILVKGVTPKYLFSGSGVEKTSVFSLTRAISGPDDNKGIISRSSTIG